MIHFLQTKRQILFIFLCSLFTFHSLQGQIVLSDEDKRILLNELKRELLDSLKKDPDLGYLFENNDIKAYKKPLKSEPFAWGDFTWLQGNNRQTKSILKSKYFTGGLTIDCNYNYSFHNPIDHTNAGSTATFRSNEFNISYIEAGGDLNYKGLRARLMLQYGTRATGVPRNDNSALKGPAGIAAPLEVAG